MPSPLHFRFSLIHGSVAVLMYRSSLGKKESINILPVKKYGKKFGIKNKKRRHDDFLHCNKKSAMDQILQWCDFYFLRVVLKSFVRGNT